MGTETVTASDLEREQSYIDAAHEHLIRMRARAEHLLSTVGGDDPDLEWALVRRVRALAESPRALCFGRTDAGDGTTWYVGRRHVEDQRGDPVVVEWRAPVAVPFYRASWSDPMGLVRRRQFVVDGRRLLSIGEDTFGRDGARHRTGEADGVRGREALLLELERARSGEMVDIVATIQPEQDEVIRAPAPGILAVQGGPGSGKTAVGLHRAAFLLYGDDAMARANILVVGPNRTFLRYIAQVLPSLGEHAVVQTTLVDLVPEIDGARDTTHRHRTARTDPPDTEHLKGDARMADVLARALGARRHSASDDLEAHIGVRRLVVAAAEIDAAAAAVARRRLPYADGRSVLRDQLIRMLAARAATTLDAAQMGRLRATPAVTAALDARWPSVAPAALVADLFSKKAQLAAAAEGILDSAEQRLLLRRSGRAWTTADAPLVDEAKAFISGQSRTYGHAIVDEAQDLSPMELRMLARRCPSGSMTLLGDLAQAIGPWGRRAWPDVARWLPGGDKAHVVELRFGYRSTAQILRLASRLLPEAAPGVRPTAAVRSGRNEPRVLRANNGPAAIAALAADEVRGLAAQSPTVAVITPTSWARDLLDQLRAAGLDVADAEVDGLGHRVTVVSASAAKGLEFDAVVVVAPEDIVSERTNRATGLRLLYVALTRPTQHLSIVAGPQPPAPLAASTSTR